MATTMQAPVISEDIWGDVEQAYYTVRYYNATGFGVEQEWTNVYAASEAEAKDVAITNYRIAQCNLYRVYAAKQESRI